MRRTACLNADAAPRRASAPGTQKALGSAAACRAPPRVPRARAQPCFGAPRPLLASRARWTWSWTAAMRAWSCCWMRTTCSRCPGPGKPPGNVQQQCYVPGREGLQCSACSACIAQGAEQAVAQRQSKQGTRSQTHKRGCCVRPSAHSLATARWLSWCDAGLLVLGAGLSARGTAPRATCAVRARRQRKSCTRAVSGSRTWRKLTGP